VPVTVVLVVALTACASNVADAPETLRSDTTTTTAATSTTLPISPSSEPSFDATVATIDASRRAAMVSWHEGCPVALNDLRIVRLRYWGFNGEVQDGELVVHRTVADDVVAAFRAIFEARFPIERMVPVDEYGGDDVRSMDDNNTSAFNCRLASGSTRWSEHAYGRAIDINPVQNPYVPITGAVEPSAGAQYVDRTRVVPGVIVSDGPVVAAFDSVGWEWGGDWTGSTDYQHFSSTGR
jgi:hypothetical protein